MNKLQEISELVRELSPTELETLKSEIVPFIDEQLNPDGEYRPDSCVQPRRKIRQYWRGR